MSGSPSTAELTSLTGAEALAALVPASDVGPIGTHAGTLYTNGANVSGTAAYFQSFDTIAYSAADLTSLVALTLTAPGVVDLSTQLLGRGVDFTGSSGNDTITTSDGDDTIHAGDGNDIIRAGLGSNIVYGEAGDDIFIVGQSGGHFVGGYGIDTLSYAETAGSIALNASDWDVEIVIGTAFDDYLYSQGGGVTLIGGPGADTLGNDFYKYGGRVSYATSPGGVTIKGGKGYGSDAEGDTLVHIVYLIGSDHDDVLAMGQGRTVEGGDGNDVIAGPGRGSRLFGGNGFDTLSFADLGEGGYANLATSTGYDNDKVFGFEALLGSAYDDRLYGDGGDNRIEGGVGDDRIRGDAGADQLIGGEGIDTISYSTSTVGVHIDLELGTASGGDADGDTFSSIENVVGSNLADILIGSAMRTRSTAARATTGSEVGPARMC